MSFEGWTDDAILAEMGDRLRRERLDRNLTQAELAERSGVSVKTIRKVEDGHNSSATTLIRLLRALGLIGRIDVLLPEPGLSPVQIAKLRGKVRQRATSGNQVSAFHAVAGVSAFPDPPRGAGSETTNARHGKPNKALEP